MSGTVGPRIPRIQIVTDGLVFYIDAGNPESYVSPSTTTDSLVGNITGSLINGVGFSTDNGGNWDFDGLDDYISIQNSTTLGFDRTTSFTIAGWFNILSNETNAPYWGKWGTNGAPSTGNYMFWAGGTTSPKVLFSVANGTSTVASTISYTYDRTRWNYWVGIYTSNTGLSFYENGILKSTTPYTGAINNTDTAWVINRAEYLSGNQHFEGKSNCQQIYNRALSADEVLYNYNALKGRFGL